MFLTLEHFWMYGWVGEPPLQLILEYANSDYRALLVEEAPTGVCTDLAPVSGALPMAPECDDLSAHDYRAVPLSLAPEARIIVL